MPFLWPRLGQKRQLVPFGFQVQVQGMRTRDTAQLSRPDRTVREVRPFSLATRLMHGQHRDYLNLWFREFQLLQRVLGRPI